jgi:alkylation response protein AidB-like acyl-CoA dehydrogenase
MSAAPPVLKPDHDARRRHFIFTEDHERLRESIHAFVVKELAPHAERWEAETFDDWVFRRMGELGFLGLSMPEAYGGQGGDYPCNLVLAEELVHAKCGGLAMGLAVHTDMATPPILAFGTEAQKQGYLGPAIRGEKISCLGITEPDAGSDVASIRTRATRQGDDYVINGAKTYITNGHRADFIVLVTKTDPDAGYDGFTLFLVDMDLPGVTRAKRLEKLGMHASDTALLAFSGTSASLPPPSSARSARASTTSCGSSRASGSSAPRAASRPRSASSIRPSTTRRSAPPSAVRSAASRSSATRLRRWRRRSRPPASSSTRPRGAS